VVNCGIASRKKIMTSMAYVKIYTGRNCAYCTAAKRLLTAKGVNFQEIDVDQDPTIRQEMIKLTGRQTVPQIFIGDHHVGGHDDLVALNRAGKLDQLLQGNS